MASLNRIIALPKPASKRPVFHLRLTKCDKCHKEQIRLIAERAARWECKHCGHIKAIEPGMQCYA